MWITDTNQDNYLSYRRLQTIFIAFYLVVNNIWISQQRVTFRSGTLTQHCQQLQLNGAVQSDFHWQTRIAGWQASEMELFVMFATSRLFKNYEIN